MQKEMEGGNFSREERPERAESLEVDWRSSDGGVGL